MTPTIDRAAYVSRAALDRAIPDGGTDYLCTLHTGLASPTFNLAVAASDVIMALSHAAAAEELHHINEAMYGGADPYVMESFKLQSAEAVMSARSAIRNLTQALKDLGEA